MKKGSYNQYALTDWKKLINFLILQKLIIPKINSFQPIGYPEARNTIEKLQKVRKLV